ncbi:hypothetical protein FBQ84_08890 [Ignavibacteria bacterium CHB1]|jgi:hypothetical protein|nr:MAG: TPR domain protein [Chlorobi bacterium OLB4]MBV6399003.1 hypothetical protein [Ignavibacteria bacterium]MBW7856682.1 hypothetical protein [Ignavibacteria bacterium]MDL1887937.1 hypothetical protein [Ignavibacteria bacterium CHB1]OQY77174.1 MAG: hypothetical protein B6D43_07560 [Ignavibacteriales bacterium UTCHB1]
MKTFKFVLIVLFSLTAVYFAKADDFFDAMLEAKKNLYEATESGNEGDIIKARGQFERIRQLNQDVWLVDYWIAMADYNIAMIGSGENDMEKVKKYTKLGLERIDGSILQRYDFADSYVLQLMLIFNRWMYESDQMESIMSATQSAETAALENDPNNPRYWLVKGISQFYTPEPFGGGVDNALVSFAKSESLFKTFVPESEIYPDWGEEIINGYIALAHLKRNDEGDIEIAKTYIDKALEISPDSEFIKNIVMKEYNSKSGK